MDIGVPFVSSPVWHVVLNSIDVSYVQAPMPLGFVWSTNEHFFQSVLDT